jgi:prepilin-type processing-associated H-X9-DG protein
MFTGYIGPNSTAPDVIYSKAYCINEVPNPPCIAPSSKTNPIMMGSRSRHSGGVNVGLCDGSCRFVSNAINLDTWRALTTSRGGEVIGDY